jgi:hypothetical protein
LRAAAGGAALHMKVNMEVETASAARNRLSDRSCG